MYQVACRILQRPEKQNLPQNVVAFQAMRLLVSIALALLYVVYPQLVSGQAKSSLLR